MDKSISALTEATDIRDANVLPIVNFDDTKKVTISTLKTNIRSGLALSTYVDSQDALKVDKVVGKGLSTEDYTTTEKSKLSGIQTGAEVNVNADWNAVSGDAQILNKPTIPSSASFIPYTGATGNIDLGEYQIKVGQIELDQTPTGTAGVGITRWNSTLGSTETTLLGGNTILKNGVDLVVRVVNKTGVALTKASYQAVRISGAQGSRLAVALGQANSDATSADTIGIACENISNNQEGFIMNVGQLSGVNTTGSLQGETWLDGDVLYLSPTTAGRITNIKPTGITGHIIVIGYVEYSHAINGAIYVKTMNGWELDELHNVYINTPLDNQALVYDSANSVWRNETVLNTDVNERNNGYTISHEFMNIITNGSFIPTAIGAGTLLAVTSTIDADHVGVATINSSATLNSGFYISTVASAGFAYLAKLYTGLQTDCIFKLAPTVDSVSPIRFGFTTGSITFADFTSGTYFEITNGTSAVGKNTNASVSSSTSSYAMTVDVWYHFRVKVVSLSSIRYEIYTMNGTQVFSQSLTTNIPTNTLLNCMFINTHGTTSAIAMSSIDYIGVTFPPMVRGALT